MRIRISGDASWILASVDSVVLSRHTDQLKTKFKSSVASALQSDGLDPKVEQVNDVLRATLLISVTTAGFNPGNYRGELMEGEMHG